MTTLGIVAALGAEARALGAARKECLLAVSGMGSGAATIAANNLVDAGATALMTFGLAGGLDPSLAAGHIVLPIEVVGPDGTRFCTAQAWRERLTSAIRERCAVSAGVVLTSERSIDSPEAKAAAHGGFGAAAVDMESASVARVAALHRIPFMCVRSIVDTAGDELPPAVLIASRSGRVQLPRLLAHLILAPGDLAPLMRLARRYLSAMRALKAVARAGPLGPLDTEPGFA